MHLLAFFKDILLPLFIFKVNIHKHTEGIQLCYFTVIGCGA
jgi:hypothetical protein